MHWGWPRNTDSSVSFTRRGLWENVCPLGRDQSKLNQYPLNRHSSSPPSSTCFLLPSLFVFVGTYLAEEITSLCLSESRILARWEATESAYWVMWTWKTERRRYFRLKSKPNCTLTLCVQPFYTLIWSVYSSSHSLRPAECKCIRFFTANKQRWEMSHDLELLYLIKQRGNAQKTT